MGVSASTPMSRIKCEPREPCLLVPISPPTNALDFDLEMRTCLYRLQSFRQHDEAAFCAIVTTVDRLFLLEKSIIQSGAQVGDKPMARMYDQEIIRSLGSLSRRTLDVISDELSKPMDAFEHVHVIRTQDEFSQFVDRIRSQAEKHVLGIVRLCKGLYPVKSIDQSLPQTICSTPSDEMDKLQRNIRLSKDPEYVKASSTALCTLVLDEEAHRLQGEIRLARSRRVIWRLSMKLLHISRRQRPIRKRRVYRKKKYEGID